ncbi:MAG TPA: uroporphyrinogen decarboxylase family protein [Armatimonadota bacterium]|nr:uroporphyrinogen decarboxylase family protein [Armatimonadota bacterium]HOS42271.1 uroporphyrinogen decarboxylase family protein [Armatimonadota bacterium]
MTERDRFLATMRYQPVDRRPLHLVGPWPDTLTRWRREGLPAGANPHAYLGVASLPTVNISPNTGLYPRYDERTLEETETVRISIDGYGRTVRDFKDHTSMPEWLDFPVKTPEDLRRVLDEHYLVDDVNARFPADWAEKVAAANASDALIVVDGGCYYWTLRSLAGVEYASYLFYDAPELVDELFERYCTVALEGLRRAAAHGRVDVIGFGEDIAYKTGPLISPAMFREFILPRDRRVMALARSLGVDLTWYDSDGDIRLFIPDYLEAGINCLAPCEVAASMVPTALRREYGRELRLIGGLDKREIAKGPAAIDAELARNRPLIEEGGYLPAIDHSVSADISWDDYQYFIAAIQRAITV